MSHATTPALLDPRAENPPAELLAPWKRGFIVALTLGLIGSAAGALISPRHFIFSYLIAFAFVMTLVLGAMFFVLLHHVVDAGWSVVVRRAAEQVMAATPLLPVLFLPLVYALFGGFGGLYPWMHDPDPHGLLAKKQAYLNAPFFLIRAAVFLGVWMLLSWQLRRHSIAQDTDGLAKHTFSLRRWSAGGLPLYAFTFTFASFDWIMSLDYAWFSTVFGVYVWSGAVVAGLGLITLMALALAKGPLNQLVTSDHLHDLGKLLFAFAVFWAYIAFSQYFLIWYANIPEETVWFLHRWWDMDRQTRSQWAMVSILLPVGHFVLPFVLLMSAHAKRNVKMLVGMSVLLLAVHYLDLYWMVMPQLSAHRVPLEAAWIDLATLLLTVGACGWMVCGAMGKAALYPRRDPHLRESLMAEHSEEVLAEEAP